MMKSRVLVVGGTGYLGKRLVKASLSEGHQTFILQRREMGVEIEKVQMLLEFKQQGAHLVTGSFADHKSLVDAVKLVDVVICAISGVHIRSHQILLQLKLVDAIKEAGNVKRFLPSEFGTDPSRMESAMEPGRVTFDDKMVVRRHIEEAGIGYTYVSANCFAGYMVGGLCQPGRILPSKEEVTLLGDGDKKEVRIIYSTCAQMGVAVRNGLFVEVATIDKVLAVIKTIFVDEDDIALYTIRSIDDPRTLNKTLYIRPTKNILSQGEVVEIWEKLIGKKLQKSYIKKEDFIASIRGRSYEEQVGMVHYYHVYYEGCLANFEIGQGGLEACRLYPQINYTTVEKYMERYL